MDLPSFRLHTLMARLKGQCAVSVYGKYRFEAAAAVDSDLVGYH